LATPPKLVAIFGTGRNGSTLLSRLLDGMPGCYVHPAEVNFLTAIDALRWRPTVPRRVHSNSISYPLAPLRSTSTRRLLRYYGGQIIEIERDYARNAQEPVTLGPNPVSVLQKSARYTAKAFVPEYLSAAGHWLEGNEDFDAVIFKTIETPYIADYESMFPEMRFIHIIRDPVKTWASLKRTLMVSRARPTFWLGVDNLITLLEHRWIPHARTILARRGNPHHFVVRYEDLTAAPEDMIQRLCRQMELPMPAEPTIQTLLGGRHFREMQMNPSQKGVAAPQEVTQNMEKQFGYSEVVTPRERALIRLRTRGLADELGYASDDIDISPGSVRKAWSAFDEWDWKNVDGLNDRLHVLVNALIKRRYVRKYT
tara:strand:- start:351 stop:1457 length:1107 start_codon:yes stop_codon:yes gene_type:complete